MGCTGISKLLELEQLVHVLFCDLVPHQLVVEMLVEKVIVGLLPDVQEGALDPGGDDGLVVGCECDSEVSGGDVVLPLGFQPDMLHDLSFPDAFHAGVFGQTEFVLEVVGEEGICEIHLGLQSFSRLGLRLFLCLLLRDSLLLHLVDFVYVVRLV